MDDEQRVSETLEQLASALDPELVLKEDEELVWGVRLNNAERIELCLLPDQRKLVCSISIPAVVPSGPAGIVFHESLLMSAYEEAFDGGISPGLGDDGLLLHYDVPMELLSVESLSDVIRQLRAAVVAWKAELPTADESSAEPPADDASNTIRV